MVPPLTNVTSELNEPRAAWVAQSRCVTCTIQTPSMVFASAANGVLAAATSATTRPAAIPRRTTRVFDAFHFRTASSGEPSQQRLRLLDVPTLD